MNAIKNAFNKLISNIKSHPKRSVALAVLAIFSITFFCLSIGRLANLIAYEWQQIANCDSFLYFTVGKGLANGLKPYSEVYENKPPLIFILSAFSYKCFGNYQFVNICSALSILSILVVPIIIAIIIVHRKKTPLVLATTIVVFTATVSLLFASYTQQNGAEVQTETLGAGLLLYSLLFLLFINEKSKIYSPSVIFTGIFIGLSTMMKEPFAIVAFACIILFCFNRKDYLKKLVFPCIYAGLICFLTLLVGNCIDTYFTIYLKNMLFSHISIYGSPFQRMTNLKALFDSLFGFSSALPKILVFGLVISIIKQLCTSYSPRLWLNVVFKLLNGLKPILCLYLASFAVGLGGQYFLHHFIFAVPLYLAFVFSATDVLAVCDNFEIRQASQIANQNDETTAKTTQTFEEQTKSLMSSQQIFKKSTAYVILAVLMFFNITTLTKLPDNAQIHQIMENEFTMVQEHTIYVDDFLDAIGADTYQWIGFNGPYPYAYTKHFPIAPLFVQDPANFDDPTSFFCKTFIEQLTKADVLIFQFDTVNLGCITQPVIAYINENFTPEMPSSMLEVFAKRPPTFYYSVYFRKCKF